MENKVWLHLDGSFTFEDLKILSEMRNDACEFIVDFKIEKSMILYEEELNDGSIGREVKNTPLQYLWKFLEKWSSLKVLDLDSTGINNNEIVKFIIP